MKIRISLLLVLTFSLFAGRLSAHEPNHSYLFLKIYEKSIEGRIEITAAEINRELNTSINEEIVESEVNPLIPAIQNYFLSPRRRPGSRINNGAYNAPTSPRLSPG